MRKQRLLSGFVRPWAYVLSWAALLAIAGESAQEHDTSSLIILAVAAIGFFLTTEFNIVDTSRVRHEIDATVKRLVDPRYLAENQPRPKVVAVAPAPSDDTDELPAVVMSPNGHLARLSRDFVLPPRSKKGAVP